MLTTLSALAKKRKEKDGIEENFPGDKKKKSKRTFTSGRSSTSPSADRCAAYFYFYCHCHCSSLLNQSCRLISFAAAITEAGAGQKNTMYNFVKSGQSLPPAASSASSGPVHGMFMWLLLFSGSRLHPSCCVQMLWTLITSWTT